MAGPALINSLPEDVLVAILCHVSVAEVFALKQTCRRMHRTIDSDYLWHQLLPRDDLPLDILPDYDLRKFSATELQASAIRALRLQANWSQKHPRVRRLNAANSLTLAGSFDVLKLLNSGMSLLGIRRDRHSRKPSMIICVYDLSEFEIPRIISHFSVPGAMKDFDACVQEGGTELVIAATVTKGDTEFLEVYHSNLPVDSPTVCNGSYETAYSFVLRREGLFHKVSLHGDFIASSVMNHSSEHGEQSALVLIANWKTQQQITINPYFAYDLYQMAVKVLPTCLAVIEASMSNVQVALIPLDVIAYGGILEQPLTSTAKHGRLPSFPRVVVPLIDFYDICISDNINFGPYVPATSLSLVIFPTLSRLEMRQSKKALYLRFLIDPSTPSTLLSTPASTSEGAHLAMPSIRLGTSVSFDIPVGSYPEYPYLGTTGRRAVWLEQSLRSDYVQVLRLDYDPAASKTPAVDVLLPPEPQLPFKPSACHAIAFDETTGRLCVSLYNGWVYVLDFV